MLLNCCILETVFQEQKKKLVNLFQYFTQNHFLAPKKAQYLAQNIMNQSVNLNVNQNVKLRSKCSISFCTKHIISIFILHCHILNLKRKVKIKVYYHKT